MLKMPLSQAATGLMRALLARLGAPRDRILLTECQSTDWQSLTFTGECHEICLRIPPPDAEAIYGNITDGLGDAEFAIPGQIVADIAVVATDRGADGSITLKIEALTVSE